MTILAVYANSYAVDGALAGWTDPTNAYADDGAYASRVGTTKNVGYGNLFGFDLSALPDGATINSVTISAEWHNSADDAAGPVFTLGAKSDNVILGTLADSSGQTSDEVHSYSPTGLTAAQLKATGATGFWAVVRFQRTDNTAHTAYVDYVKCIVDYSTGGAEITGAADIVIDAVGSELLGAVTVSGNSPIALDGITTGAVGAVTITAISAGIMDGMTADISGAVQAQDAITGSLSTTLDALTGAGQGAVTITGASQNAFSMSIAATGLVGVTGSISKTLDGMTGEITGVVGNAPLVGLLDATFAGMTCQMVGAVRINGAVSLVLEGMSAWITAWTEDLYSLQPGSKRRIKALRPEPARVIASAAARSKRQESFKVEGD